MSEKEVVPKVEKTEKSSKGKTAKVVSLRNRFFFILYRNSILVFLASLGSFIFSIFFLMFFAKQPIPPQYIPINEDGTYIKMEPLSKCKEDAEVIKFSSAAMKKMYKYDYINYADQFQDAASYFTAPGWNEYLDEFGRSKTLAGVKENKWVVTINPTGVPEILKKGVDHRGICVWDVKTEVNIMYVGQNSLSPRGDLHLRIVRNSVINNPEGLGVEKVVFIEAKI